MYSVPYTCLCTVYTCLVENNQEAVAPDQAGRLARFSLWGIVLRQMAVVVRAGTNQVSMPFGISNGYQNVGCAFPPSGDGFMHVLPLGPLPGRFTSYLYVERLARPGGYCRPTSAAGQKQLWKG